MVSQLNQIPVAAIQVQECGAPDLLRAKEALPCSSMPVPALWVAAHVLWMGPVLGPALGLHHGPYLLGPLGKCGRIFGAASIWGWWV